MNYMINRLPTRTWNHLGMNEARVQLEGAYTNHIPEVSAKPAEVIWNERAGEVPHGAHGDLEQLVAALPAALAKTKQGVQMESPLVLRYTYAPSVQEASRLVLHAESGSRLNVVLVLSSPAGADGTTAIQTEVYAEDNAVIDLCVVQLQGEKTTALFNAAGICAESSRFNLTKLELGAQKLYAGANIDLQGDESSFTTEIAYHGRRGQTLDMNYVALHHGKRTESFMQANGTLEDGSKKIFRGTIDFQKGCCGSVGNENENVLLLGDNMVNQTIPLILCKEEDVEGNHGASIGRLDDKVLFYLGSRGIAEDQAQEIIAQARIDAVCDKIPVEEIQEQAREYERTRGNGNHA